MRTDPDQEESWGMHLWQVLVRPMVTMAVPEMRANPALPTYPAQPHPPAWLVSRRDKSVHQIAQAHPETLRSATPGRRG